MKVTGFCGVVVYTSTWLDEGAQLESRLRHFLFYFLSYFSRAAKTAQNSNLGLKEVETGCYKKSRFQNRVFKMKVTAASGLDAFIVTIN